MKVAFSYIDSLDHLRYRPIIKRLRGLEHEVFCVEGGDPNWIDRDWLRQLLKLDNLTFHHPEGPMMKVDIVITTKRKNTIRDVRGRHYVRLIPSLGNGTQNYDRNFNLGFDLILVPGTRVQHLIRQEHPAAPTKVIGLPMLDVAFGLPETSSFDICYAPTWNQFSSIGTLGETIAQLTSRFPGRCLFRPHPTLVRRSPHWVQLFKDYGWEIPVELYPLGVTARRCGVMFADEGSGVVWECAMLNDFTAACRNLSAPDTLVAKEVSRFVHVLETPDDVLRLTDFFPHTKAIPKKYCDFRGFATQKCVEALESLCQ